MLAFRSLALAVIVLTVLSFWPMTAWAQSKGAHVSGSATIRVPADLVTLTTSMETTDDDLVRVRQTSDKQAQTILDHLKKQGGAEGSFQVTSMSLTFGYNAQLKRQIYNVNRGIKLELNDVAKLDALLADLLKEPFLKIDGITFGTSKQREHEFAARAKAIADAREKAKQLAELSGLRLGKAYNILVVGERQVPFAASAMPAPAAPPAPALPAPSLPAPTAAIELPRLDTFARQDTPVALPVAVDAQGQTLIQAPAPNKTFGIGEIVITAEVSIDFELE